MRNGERLGSGVFKDPQGCLCWNSGSGIKWYVSKMEFIPKGELMEGKLRVTWVCKGMDPTDTVTWSPLVPRTHRLTASRYYFDTVKPTDAAGLKAVEKLIQFRLPGMTDFGGMLVPNPDPTSR